LGPVDYFSSIVGNLFEEFFDTIRLKRIIKKDLYVKKGNEVLKYVKNKMEFQNVSFSYPRSKCRNIDDINFTIEKGSKVVFVRPNGVKKSTIFKLLMQMFVPIQDGTILIDGQDIKTLKTDL